MTKVLTSFLLLCLAASLVAWAVLLLHERGLHPLRDAVKFVRRLSWGGRLAVLPLFFALLVFGSTKDNGELRVESGELRVDSGELRVESGEANVANETVLPIFNSNNQLETGNIGIGNISTLATLTPEDSLTGLTGFSGSGSDSQLSTLNSPLSTACSCGCGVDTNGVVTISENCNCDPCSFRGGYGYEGYMEYFEFEYYPEEEEEGGDPDDPEEPEDPPDDEPEASVSVWFEESAVIFEDEYENSPGVVVPRRSTRTTLKCSVYGGERGGNFTVDMSGMTGLRLVSGTPPSGRSVGQRERVEFEAVYEGESASSQEDGTVARVSFTENETNTAFEDDAKITVAQIEVSSMASRPMDCRNRHIYGICEEVQVAWRPNRLGMSWDNNGSGRWISIETGARRLQCEDHACQMSLRAIAKGVTHDVLLSCVEPAGIVCELTPTFLQRSGLGHGDAGDVGLDIIFTVCPTTVSFQNVRIKEMSSTVGTHTGYFAMPGWENFWYHTTDHGAEEIVVLNDDNDGIDAAYMGYCPSPWSSGSMTWEIPAAWQPPLLSGSAKAMEQFTTYQQQFQIIADGCVSVSKFGHTAERGTNTVKKINGVVVE